MGSILKNWKTSLGGVLTSVGLAGLVPVVSSTDHKGAAYTLALGALGALIKGLFAKDA